ncbi:hypothetical protein COO09_17380 [Rhizorhabdus dicambivorans]|uniref:Uncharacterized protein n=2 Tax=Rhizorhabdus dicambivorans TaxID=1850238 RepID=A0A2A4FU98_9SPHN|nr:hypothetical protein CMV14_15470 [Rhizorhabdus dicambivorans]PCE40971.1 hypothetical protein COO09_17380 [Rhizorhabdus dicambivorans]
MLLLALVALPTAAGAKRPLPPTGELLLDMAEPVIETKIGDVKLRLRVALDQKRLIELNPDAVERLKADPPSRRFRFENGLDAYVGREPLPSIEATAPIKLNGRKMLVTLSSHGRPCCAGVDGEIGIGLLPYATIRFVRAGQAPADRSADFLIDDNDVHGPQASVPVGRRSINILFSLERPESFASSSAGAILAREYGGKLTDGGRMVAAFGIERPISMLRFRQPAPVAGFVYKNLPVRTADFAGREEFPSDPDDPDDIVVKRRVKQQDAWPVVMIGRDRTDRCSEALYDTIAKRLTLRCSGILD